MPNIVTVNVTQTVAPNPSQLQKKGAFISRGATTVAIGASELLTASTGLATILRAAVALASLTQVAGLATGTLKSTTIAAGTYNGATGQVTLTLTADIGAEPGAPVTIDNATGTGAVASIEGTYPADDGSDGTTLKYTIATGLTLTIAGGDVNASLGLEAGDTFWTTVSGATQAGYNITALATVATDKTFTYDVATGTVSPATGTPAFTQPGVTELVQMNTTFWAQGSQQPVYVLELGPGAIDDGVDALDDYLDANPDDFYSVLVPRAWAGEASWATLLDGRSDETSKFYGFTTVTATEYAAFADIKSAVCLIEAPAVVDTEFSMAAAFWTTLNYKPSSTNKVTPLAFSYVNGVTAYPEAGNGALLTTLRAAGVNYISTGAEGGVSNKTLVWGTTMDVNPFNYWYSVDWVQITGAQAIANAVINGSNNPQNPLYYNQNGIDRLQQAMATVMNNGITYGLVLGNVRQTSLNAVDFQIAIDAGDFAGESAVNAQPFVAYTTDNPTDYAAGTYDGIGVQFTPLRGFESITLNINVTQFVTG